MRAVLVLAVAAVMSSCQPEVQDFPPAPQVVDVSMTEYEYLFDSPKGPGRIVFEVDNAGRLDHELVLVAVPEGLPPIDEQLRSDERVVVPTVARVAPRASGRRGTFAVDLGPGRYAVVCFVQDGDGDQHAQKGMSAEFTIPE